MSVTDTGTSPADCLWARAAYFSRYSKDTEITAEHLLIALVAEPSVRAVFRAAHFFVDDRNPFMVAQALPLIDIMHGEASRLLQDFSAVQDVWKAAGIGPDLIDLTLADLVRERVNAAAVPEPDTGILSFRAPISYADLLTAMVHRPPITRALRAASQSFPALIAALRSAEERLGRASPPMPAAAPAKMEDADLQLSPALRAVRRQADYECRRSGDPATYPAHVLQAVFDQGGHPQIAESRLYRLLTGPACLLDANRVREAMEKTMQARKENQQQEQNMRSGGVAMSEANAFQWDGEVKDLLNFGRDLCGLAKADIRPKVVERDAEVDQIVRSLLRMSVFVLGQAGSGKDATVRAFADRLIAGDVPDALKGKTLLEIDLRTASANNGSTIDRIVDLLKKNRRIIPVFKNGDFLGDHEYSLPIRLRAAMQKDDIRAIGLSTPDLFKNVTRWPDLKARLRVVQPRALSHAEIVGILTPEAERLEARHGVHFSPDVIEGVVAATGRYPKPAQARPGLDVAYLADVAAFIEAERPSDRPQTPSGEKIARKEDIAAALNAEETRSSLDDVLSAYCRDLTKLAAEGRLDPVVGRQKEIAQLSRGLALKGKNSVALVGDAGIGKTAIVEGLAQRIANHEIPIHDGKRVLELDLSLVVAGTKYRGEFEERLKNITRALAASHDDSGRNSTIVFIDEMHTILGAGSAEGTLDASNILKPALARGEISAIGATTPREYRKYIEKDAALARRFQKVKVVKPTDAETRQILQGMRADTETFYKVRASDAFYDACVDYSNRYTKGNSNQPDIAKTLANMALARVQVSDDYQAGADGYKTADLAALNAEIFDQTGNTVGDLAGGEPEDPDILIPAMKQEVLFQDGPIEALGNAIGMKRSGHADERKPIVIALFGKTGIGKTEIGYRQLAKLTRRPSLKLNMAAYKDKMALNRLIGSGPGYVDSDKGGVLTEFMKQNPYSIVCLDEIEKADPEVLSLLLSVFEDGELEDGRGDMVDFKNAIFTLPGNIQIKGKRDLGFTGHAKPEKYSADLLNEIVEASAGKFTPEFVNRIDEIVFCNDLPGKDQMGAVIKIMLDALKTRRANAHLGMRVTDGAIDYLLDKGGTSLKFGARPYKRVVEREVQKDLSKAAWRKKYNPDADTIVDIDVEPDRSSLTFRFTEAAAEAERLGPSGVFNFHAGLLETTKPAGAANDDTRPGTDKPALIAV